MYILQNMGNFFLFLKIRQINLPSFPVYSMFMSIFLFYNCAHNDIYAPIVHSFMPSAPSPQFPGLAASPPQHTSEEGFSFMHESEVDRSMINFIL